jgi:hypothetical protein
MYIHFPLGLEYEVHINSRNYSQRALFAAYHKFPFDFIETMSVMNNNVVLLPFRTYE